MRFIDTITDLSTMPPFRAGPVNDENSSRLLQGLVLEQTEGVDFALGRAARRREMFRGRARTRGLRQVTHSQLDEQGRVILLMRWYRKRYGDLSVTTPPKRRPATQRS